MTEEQEIRELVQRWMEASAAGDAHAVLDMTADDVVFLLPGRGPMYREEFAAALQNQSSAGRPAIDGYSEIQEIRVLGEWAFMWTKLRVAATPPGGAAPVVRSGHTLTILRKERGHWLLARDANLLVPE